MKKLLLMLALGVMTFMTSYAQTRQISGKVTDTKGAAIANASVIVKGTTSGTNTSEDGSFKLNLPANAKTLVVKSINYVDLEVAVGTSNSITIKMTSTANNLEDVVVVGYGTTKKQLIRVLLQQLKLLILKTYLLPL